MLKVEPGIPDEVISDFHLLLSQLFSETGPGILVRTFFRHNGVQ
jgi:hypothetical protein